MCFLLQRFLILTWLTQERDYFCLAKSCISYHWCLPAMVDGTTTDLQMCSAGQKHPPFLLIGQRNILEDSNRLWKNCPHRDSYSCVQVLHEAFTSKIDSRECVEDRVIDNVAVVVIGTRQVLHNVTSRLDIGDTFLCITMHNASTSSLFLPFSLPSHPPS